eukprot:TRINITY_DN81_c0_g1_i2.p1 TRINITY_DN81_c0_g1~~TRINITY_DN81_c0_g1_i2.p1  ORF type:complete len:347 (-),score=33.68 TRINITY_DN81_c0_g1_i2:99-1139(-)
MADSLFLNGHTRRFGEALKFLPVAFVCAIICCLYVIYAWLYCWPLINDPETSSIGQRRLITVSIVTLMLVVCYVKCIVIHPGWIPEADDDPKWCREKPGDARRTSHCSEDETVTVFKESKRTGDRRYCKWCAKYKPDRCHHCRVCQTCILRMDHHCPWLYNCVGFRNHKYFVLLLFYTTIDTHFIAWTMIGTVQDSVDDTVPFRRMFLLLFGESLAMFIGLLVTAFFSLHIWLIFKALTTIEFCEKQAKRMTSDSSPYDRGVYGNICAALGENMLLWFLPCSPPSGSGLDFFGEETISFSDQERGRVVWKEISKKHIGRYGAVSDADAALQREDGKTGSKLSGPQN